MTLKQNPFAAFNQMRGKFKEKPREWLILTFSCTLLLLLFVINIPLDRAIQAKVFGGYYFCFVLFLLLVATTYSVLKGLPLRAYLREHRRGLIVVLLAAIGVHLFQPHRMELFNDEPAHQMNAKMMHLERQNSIPEIGYHLAGGIVYLDRNVNSRMYFYPFLVSILHDLTGFRVVNGLALNALIGGLLFLVVYLGGNRIYAKGGGVMAVALLFSLPLLDEAVTSYGYDATNLLFISAVFLGLSHYAERPNAKFLNWTVILAICAAYTRNESLLYLLPVVLVFWVRFLDHAEANITRIVSVSPLLLLPIPAARIIFEAFMGKLLLDAPEVSSESLFSLQSIPGNFIQVGQWMFDFSSTVPASPFLAFLGCAGLLALTVNTLSKAVGEQNFKDGDLMFLSFSATAVSAFVFVTLSWFWSPASGGANRLLLPIHLCMAYWGVWFIANTKQSEINFKRAILGTALAIFLVAIPTKMRDVRAETRVFAKYAAWANQWVANHADNRPLYISQINTCFLFHGHPAVGMSRGNSDIDRLSQLIAENYYGELIVFEIEKFDAANGRWVPSPPAPPLDPSILTEVIDERRWAYNQRARFRRVIGYTTNEGNNVYLKDLKPWKYDFETFDAYAEAMLRLHPGLVW